MENLKDSQTKSFVEKCNNVPESCDPLLGGKKDEQRQWMREEKDEQGGGQGATLRRRKLSLDIDLGSV